MARQLELEHELLLELRDLEADRPQDENLGRLLFRLEAAHGMYDWMVVPLS